MRTTLTASGAVAGVSMPVTIALYPPAAIPLAVLAVFAAAIVVWHLNRGRRLTVRRTSKGSLTIVLDTASRKTGRGAK